MAIRSGEPFRLQIYEFLHTLAQGGIQSQFSELHLSNGEDQGASGTGLGVLINPMLKVLDEMYSAQDELIKYEHFHHFFSMIYLSSICSFFKISCELGIYGSMIMQTRNGQMKNLRNYMKHMRDCLIWFLSFVMFHGPSIYHWGQ